MKYARYVTTLLALLACAAKAPATDVSGDQTGTWTLAGSPYYLVGDVRVPPGQSLTIEPGVQVIALGHFKLTVEASWLTAVGTPGQLILMTAQDQGAGWRGLRLEASDDATHISYCIVEYAKGTGGYPEVRGGGIMIRNCSPTVSNCEIRFNYSHNSAYNGTGGGICTESSSALILDNFVHDNIADSGGGICTLEYGSPTVTGNIITDNTALYAGGGMYFGARSSPLIEANVIMRNSAGIYGGGGINSWTSYIFYNTQATIRNNLIAHNTATNGGGLYCRYDRAIITNNVIAHNTAYNGGGIYALNYPDQAPQVTNCILWENTAPNGAQVYRVPDTGSQISITYSDIQGGWAGTGNIDADPMFVAPGSDDYRLSAGSPCIDAADNTAVPKGIDTDLDGNPRFVDDPATKDTGNGDPPIVDMGAYEFQVVSPCPWDLDGDRNVGVKDLLILLGAWGPNKGHPADLDDSGDVGVKDLLILLGNWGPCP